EHLAGGVEGDEVERQAEPAGQFAREIGGDSARLAGPRVFLGQDRIAEIDRGAEPAGGRERLENVGRKRRSLVHGQAFRCGSWKAANVLPTTLQYASAGRRRRATIR